MKRWTWFSCWLIQYIEDHVDSLNNEYHLGKNISSFTPWTRAESGRYLRGESRCIVLQLRRKFIYSILLLFFLFFSFSISNGGDRSSHQSPIDPTMSNERSATNCCSRPWHNRNERHRYWLEKINDIHI